MKRLRYGVLSSSTVLHSIVNHAEKIDKNSIPSAPGWNDNSREPVLFALALSSSQPLVPTDALRESRQLVMENLLKWVCFADCG